MPRQNGVDQVERGVQVGRHHALPLLHRHLQDGLVRAHRHVAHQHVHRAQGLDALGDHIGHAVGVCHVADDRMGLDAQLAAFRRHRLQFLG